MPLQQFDLDLTSWEDLKAKVNCELSQNDHFAWKIYYNFVKSVMTLWEIYIFMVNIGNKIMVL